jgi:hypothetical protein
MCRCGHAFAYILGVAVGDGGAYLTEDASGLGLEHALRRDVLEETDALHVLHADIDDLPDREAVDEVDDVGVGEHAHDARLLPDGLLQLLVRHGVVKVLVQLLHVHDLRRNLRSIHENQRERERERGREERERGSKFSGKLFFSDFLSPELSSHPHKIVQCS